MNTTLVLVPEENLVGPRGAGFKQFLRVLDIGVDGEAYVVREWIAGGSMSDLLAAERPGDEPQKSRRVLGDDPGGNGRVALGGGAGLLGHRVPLTSVCVIHDGDARRRPGRLLSYITRESGRRPAGYRGPVRIGSG
jgi:hypothetical protein